MRARWRERERGGRQEGLVHHHRHHLQEEEHPPRKGRRHRDREARDHHRDRAHQEEHGRAPLRTVGAQDAKKPLTGSRLKTPRASRGQEASRETFARDGRCRPADFEGSCRRPAPQDVVLRTSDARLLQAWRSQASCGAGRHPVRGASCEAGRATPSGVPRLSLLAMRGGGVYASWL